MTKDVIVSIRGLQFAEDGSEEPVEVISAGTYYKKNQKHYIIYDELMEGFAEPTKNRIKVADGLLEISKAGVANTQMRFEKDKKNMSYYSTPFGNILLGIEASDIRIEEDENHMEVDIAYDLELNYEHLAECKIHIQVQSKEGSEFHLMK